METQQNLQQNSPKLNIGFFFLSLGVLVSLITSVVSFLNLVFNTLNKRFPDVLNSNYQYGYSTYDYESIRSALATLVIFFPVFLIVSYFWNKFTKGMMGNFDQLVKKWMIYIILFLASIVLIVDLVTLVKYFLSGEITTRFILKVLVTLVVALYVGVYYVCQLMAKEKIFGFSVGLWSAIKSSIIVVLMIWFSFSVMGSPAKQRMLRLDDRRLGDIQGIQNQVIGFWQQKEKLPTELAELSDPTNGFSLPVPPEFEKGEQYEYKVIDAKALKFELCATFALPIPQGWREYSSGGMVPMPYYSEKDVAMSARPPYGGINESWDHQAGRTCFERTIDKDIYPPFKKQ
ncbi:MAG: hypothetical protein KBC06_01430 [Candidatus Pacebacteria bacterium]|nr:hypothetical protein [Candidatus Paceibacterota bacterium]